MAGCPPLATASQASQEASGSGPQQRAATFAWRTWGHHRGGAPETREPFVRSGVSTAARVGALGALRPRPSVDLRLSEWSGDHSGPSVAPTSLGSSSCGGYRSYKWAMMEFGQHANREGRTCVCVHHELLLFEAERPELELLLRQTTLSQVVAKRIFRVGGRLWRHLCRHLSGPRLDEPFIAIWKNRYRRVECSHCPRRRARASARALGGDGREDRAAHPADHAVRAAHPPVETPARGETGRAPPERGQRLEAARHLPASPNARHGQYRPRHRNAGSGHPWPLSPAPAARGGLPCRREDGDPCPGSDRSRAAALVRTRRTAGA